MNIFNKKVEFIAAVCPKCGGRLELDVNFEVAYCSNCGTQCIIRNAKKRVKRSSLDKILEFAEKQNNVRRHDIQEYQRKKNEKKQLDEELRIQRKEERKQWWSKHWLKITIISLIVFIISLFYNYLMN